jgi:hypothetical protein
METTYTEPPPASGTPLGTEISSSALAQQTTQIVPGTTVIGTGSTGDVWSYTIPDVTNVIPLSASTAPSTPTATLVPTNIIVPGTTVTGGVETGVPWTYTAPETTILSSVLVPITLSPVPTTSSPETSATSSSSLSNSLATSSSDSSTASDTSSSLPTPPPATPSPEKDTSALSGGIVAAVLGALLLIIFAGATFLCLRVRRRRRRVGTEWDRAGGEKDIGVIWGKGWGSEDKGVGWRKVRPGLIQGGSGSGGGSGGGSGVVNRFRDDPEGAGSNLNAQLTGQEANERQIHEGEYSVKGISFRAPILIGYADRQRIRYPYPGNALPQPTHISPTHDDSYTNITTANDTYPSSSQYLHPHTDPDTRNAPLHNRKPNTNTKPPRIVPPPSQFVYAPPPDPQPSPLPIPSTSPHGYRTTPSDIHRAASPHGYQSSNPSRGTSPNPGFQGPNRLTKQRITPSASAFLRHMVPVRGASLRRSRPPAPITTATTSAARPASTARSGPGPSAGAGGPTRPGIATLPSFIRERQFSPSHSGAVSSSGESALFSPRTSRPHLPLPHTRGNFATSRDGLLSPPPFSRDRSSQMTSTTRSGGTGHSGESRYTGRSRDSRFTGRSGDSRLTGRSGDSRLTGRSADSRLTGRSGRLGQIKEGQRGWEVPTEPVVGPGMFDGDRGRRQ